MGIQAPAEVKYGLIHRLVLKGICTEFLSLYQAFLLVSHLAAGVNAHNSGRGAKYTRLFARRSNP